MNTRPDWDHYLMSIAAVVATRSHDSETQHGAVVVDRHHRILGVGYNGLPRGGDEAAYPTERPGKYPYMLHSEVNAVLNCSHRPEGGSLYVTGCPCCRCMLVIVQAGIRRVVYGRVLSASVGPDEQAGVDLLARNHDVDLVYFEDVAVGPLRMAMRLLEAG